VNVVSGKRPRSLISSSLCWVSGCGLSYSLPVRAGKRNLAHGEHIFAWLSCAMGFNGANPLCGVAIIAGVGGHGCLGEAALPGRFAESVGARGVPGQTDRDA
jgi:hypothetical protein